MSINWDYAEMAKLAKEAGGPKVWLDLIKENSFNEGAKAMQKKYVPYIVVACVAGIAVGGAITISYVKIKKRIAINREKRMLVNVAANEAEKLLIQDLDDDQVSSDCDIEDNLEKGEVK